MEEVNILAEVEKIGELAKQAIPENDGDFRDDQGLLVCGRCGQRKEGRYDFGGYIAVKRCMCDCETARYKAEREMVREEERKVRIMELRQQGFHDRAMQMWTFANDDGKNAELSTLARNYVAHFGEMLESGKGLLLFGNTGTGKSFISACICNALIDKGVPCLFTNLPMIEGRVKSRSRAEALDELDEFALVVLDDLMAERDTVWMAELVNDVVDKRARSGKPLIVTTNMTAEEIKGAADMRRKRVISRLYEMCFPYEVKGSDRRRDELKNDYSKLADLLGLKK